MVRIKSAWILVLPFLFCLTLTPLHAKRADTRTETQKEIDLGRESAKEVEKQCKLITDEAIINRVRSIGEEIAKVALTEEVPASYGDSEVSQFEYTFKVIDDKNVNAFCLPGGFIYVNKGLLDFVQSDHELAAVLAHEIAHAAHHHIRSLTKEQSKLHRRLALILLAGLIGNIPQADMGNVLLGTQFYKTAKLSGYGQLAEKDADLTAISYLCKTEYNPVGMLTFLERLSRSSDLVELGILQTHPRTKDRITDVIIALKERNIPINRRSVTRFASASVREVKVNDQTVQELVIGGKPVIKLAGKEERAKEVADRLNSVLDSDLTMKDLKSKRGQTTVMAGTRVILEVSQKDADLNGITRAETARKLAEGLRRAVWQEMIDMIR